MPLWIGTTEMYEFPASPAIGDVANGYRFDGTGWGGGPAVPTPTEQFFDLSGLTTKDIAVPVWAKGVQITASIIPPASGANTLVLRLSGDGTTFAAGATDYNIAAPYHISLPTPTYSTQPLAVASYMTLGMTGATSSLQHLIDSYVTLERKLTSEGFASRSYARAYDATQGSSTAWFYSYAVGNVPPGVLRVAALRFFLAAGGIFGNGSFIQVKWVGGQVPQANGIVPEAPMDGNEYVRVNGVWRLRKQEVSMSGLQQADVAVPDWNPKLARVYFNTCCVDTTAYSMVMRCSVDGTTFLAGATDYYNAALYGPAAAAGNALYSPAVAYTWAYIGFSANNTSVPNFGTVDVVLERAGGTFVVNSTASHYGATGYGVSVLANYLSGGFGSAQRLKALRLIKNAGGVMSAGSRFMVEWL